jgi:DNA-3-methyladenine glycosylase
MDVRQALEQPATEVAEMLLGWTLTHASSAGMVSLTLTEVEAYMGASDPASHAYLGRTARNASMFAGPGHLYVYRSHGLHWCCNVVTGRVGEPSAVLLRAGRVTDGLPLARVRRGENRPDAALARGPGCLAHALGITGADDGAHLLTGGNPRLSPSARPPASTVSGPRIGISKATDLPWRYWLPDDPTVSRARKRTSHTPG